MCVPKYYLHIFLILLINCFAEVTLLSNNQQGYQANRKAEVKYNTPSQTHLCCLSQSPYRIFLITQSSLSPGDRIEFDRGAYSHFGIYVGVGIVIHLTGIEEGGIRENINSQHSLSVCGHRFDKAQVAIDIFCKVVGNDKAFKNNEKDSELKALAAEEIVARAKSKMGKAEYNPLSSNCEHFVNWSRYNLAESDQVKNLVLGGLCAVGILVVMTVVVFVYKNINPPKTMQNGKYK